jgi:hypothetical protein
MWDLLEGLVIYGLNNRPYLACEINRVIAIAKAVIIKYCCLLLKNDFDCTSFCFLVSPIEVLV